VGKNDSRVERELIFAQQDKTWQRRLDVDRGAVEIDGHVYRSSDSHELFVAQRRDIAGAGEIDEIRAALASIAIYPYFTTGASWAGVRDTGLRGPTRPEPGARLLPTGDNLAAALHSLREEEPAAWELFIEIVKLAFPRCKDIRLPPAVSGYVQIAWVDTGFDQPFDASELSDGTLVQRFHRFLPRGPNKAGEWFVVAIISTALLLLRGSVRYFIALESPPDSPPSAAEPVSATS
jgi:hypothetical protein